MFHLRGLACIVYIEQRSISGLKVMFYFTPVCLRDGTTVPVPSSDCQACSDSSVYLFSDDSLALSPSLPPLPRPCGLSVGCLPLPLPPCSRSIIAHVPRAIAQSFPPAECSAHYLCICLSDGIISGQSLTAHCIKRRGRPAALKASRCLDGIMPSSVCIESWC